MSNIPCIAMEHQHRKFLRPRFWSSEIKCRQLLSIRGRDHKLFEVCDAELRGSGNFGTGKVWDMRGVDESSVKGAVQGELCFSEEGEGGCDETGQMYLLLLEVQQRAQNSSDALPPL